VEDDSGLAGPFEPAVADLHVLVDLVGAGVEGQQGDGRPRRGETEPAEGDGVGCRAGARVQGEAGLAEGGQMEVFQLQAGAGAGDLGEALEAVLAVEDESPQGKVGPARDAKQGLAGGVVVGWTPADWASGRCLPLDCESRGAVGRNVQDFLPGV